MIFIESASASTWIPVVTLLLGFATGQVTDWVKDRRAYKRDLETRRETRNDTQQERHNDFQRETLLNLQTAAMELMRSASQLHFFDKRQFRKAWQTLCGPLS